MSYILDALRRADAERDRGAVPGLHAQPAALGELDAEAPRPARKLLWVGAAALLTVLAAGAWWMLSGSEPPRIASAAGVVAAPAAEVPAPAAVAAAPVAAPPMAAPPAVQAPVPAAPGVVPPRSVPADAPVVARKQAPRPAPAPRAVPASGALGRRPATLPETLPASAPAAATDPRVYQLSELPDDIRRELPTLAIGGAMYSPNPANRMLIVNGQAFHEGDRLAPNLSLEQIRLKSALLEYKGYRYRITY